METIHGIGPETTTTTGTYPDTRHGCGPGEALPADTVTEGARLPRRTRSSLVFEYIYLYLTEKRRRKTWQEAHEYHQRLADLAGQIAGMND